MTWIDCKKQMPTSGVDILMYIPVSGMFVGNYVYIAEKTTGKKRIKHHPAESYYITYEFDSCCYGNKPSVQDVTHWMTLPKEPCIDKAVMPIYVKEKIYTSTSKHDTRCFMNESNNYKNCGNAACGMDGFLCPKHEKVCEWAVKCDIHDSDE